MVVNPAPASVSDEKLEQDICKALFLNGHNIKWDNLLACHRLKKKETVIVNFKCRKHKRRVHVDTENFRNKSGDLRQLKLSGKLFTSESMCHDSYQLEYKFCQLKNALKIHSTRFCNYGINVRLNERSIPVKIFHIVDTEKLFGIGNLDEFISNTSFYVFHLFLPCIFMFPTHSNNFL